MHQRLHEEAGLFSSLLGEYLKYGSLGSLKCKVIEEIQHSFDPEKFRVQIGKTEIYPEANAER